MSKVDYLDYLKTKEGKWNWIVIAVLLIVVALLGKILLWIGVIILIILLFKQYKEKKDKEVKG